MAEGKRQRRDLIIIGAGPAGLSAGIYAHYFGLESSILRKIFPEIELPETKASEKVHEAGWLAEKYCLVSRPVACSVDYKLEIGIKEK